MKKLIVIALLLVGSIAAVATCDFPYGTVVVAKSQYVAQSTSFTWQTVYTVPADGDYRVWGMHYGPKSCSWAIDLGNDPYGNDLQMGGGDMTAHLLSGNIIQAQATNCSGTGNYDFYIVVEKL
jgi:hypothetical protein